MLQAAKRARRRWPEELGGVADFVLSRKAPDGGFMGRTEESDLYYTIFAVECLEAVGAAVPREELTGYIKWFGDGEELDFVHLACLARLLSVLDADDGKRGAAVLRRIEEYRARDGGYSNEKNALGSTAYASFLALGAYQDLGAEVPRFREFLDSLLSLRSRDGAFANAPEMKFGLTPATAAAITVFGHSSEPLASEVGEWLLSRHSPSGGFFAIPQAPVPDLLSTATALHALSVAGVSVAGVRDACRDFVLRLKRPGGGFAATWADELPDVEYTFYALLSLGHLAGDEG